MKYLQSTFTLPTGGSKLSDDAWLLATGQITQAEYDRRQRANSKSAPSKDA
jgi:hypothetical protein